MQPPTHPFPFDLARGLALLDELPRIKKPSGTGTVRLTMTDDQFDLLMSFLAKGCEHAGLRWMEGRKTT